MFVRSRGAALAVAMVGGLVACGGARTAGPTRPPPPVAAPAPAPPTATPAPAPADAPASAPAAEPEGVRDFDFVVEHMRRNYAGYPDKVPGHEDELAALTQSTRAAIAADPSATAAQIRTWLAWFRDQHVGLDERVDATAAAGPTPEELAALERAWAAGGERVTVTAAELRAAERRPRRGRDPYVGLWESDDGVYRVLVQRPDAGARWRGVVIASTTAAWVPGQIKFRLAIDDGRTTGAYAMRNHRELPTAVTVLAGGDLLRFDEVRSVFRRVGSRAELDRYAPARTFFLRPLSAQTLWLRLPDFRAEHRAQIEQLLTEHAALLERTPNLVIDLRNNEGGTDWSYEQLMGWLYTRPIYTPGVEFRVSAANADALEAYATDPAAGEDQRRVVVDLVARMRAATGPWVPFGDRPLDIARYPTIHANPAQVGILITGAGSSGEQFVLGARQSRKVTLFGGNTAGILDYSNVLTAALPSGKFTLRYSGSRSLRLPDEPIDNVGIAPDVRLDDADGDPIGYVQRWLEARTAPAVPAAKGGSRRAAR